MKRYILTMVSVWMALTTFAQTMVVVDTESEEQEYIDLNNLEISFWGQPQGEEQNGDLAVTLTEVNSEGLSFCMKAVNNSLYDCGLYLSEQAGEWIYSDVTTVQGMELPYNEGKHCYSFGGVDFDEEDNFLVTITGLNASTTYYIKPYAIVGTETFWGTEKSFTPSSVINSVVAQDATDMESVPFTYYTLDGIQLSAPQKGFNLIKMSDGQVKKVWVK